MQTVQKWRSKAITQTQPPQHLQNIKTIVSISYINKISQNLTNNTEDFKRIPTVEELKQFIIKQTNELLTAHLKCIKIEKKLEIVDINVNSLFQNQNAIELYIIDLKELGMF
ncbi:Hypothetical_protein [Hexamita inflata]|uniref:Hypothetical_protein n=1 Tax=Hexamita inflata TaxID=28002 RepID=A0AA86R6U8_9EUKA|nr:Hypothetical protein HINF_LOCUS59285 [Hexamita inflata]